MLSIVLAAKLRKRVSTGEQLQNVSIQMLYLVYETILLFGAFSSFLPQILQCVPRNEALALRVSVWEQAGTAVHWHVREWDHI